ncbi:very short patch repair endonuclease [Flavobacterium sp.]
MKKERTYIRDGRAPVPVNEVTSRVMSAIKAKNTKPELVLRKALWNNGLRGYRLHWKKVPGKPDIVFAGRKLAIFINGCFWHRCPHCKPRLPKTNLDFWEAKFHKNTERDTKKIADLAAFGWESMTFWECQLKDPQQSVEVIREALKERNVEKINHIETLCS